MLRLGLLAVVLACPSGFAQESPREKTTNDKQNAPEKKKPKHEIEPIVRNVVAERLRTKPQLLDMNKPIADELDVVQIVMTLEERLKLEIPDKVIEKQGKGKLGEPTCKLSPSQLVVIVEECRVLAAKK